MPKFMVFATEVVKYMKEVKADSIDQVEKMIGNGEVDFDYGDITDGWDFEVSHIDEEKRYA